MLLPQLLELVVLGLPGMRKTNGARLVLVQMELAQVLVPMESKEVSQMMMFSQTCGNSISCLNAFVIKLHVIFFMTLVFCEG